MAQAGDAVLSLAWDWQALDDGALVEDFECPPRSSIMFVCERGYDLGMVQTDEILQKFICELTWREKVALAVATPARGREDPLGAQKSFKQQAFAPGPAYLM